MKIDFTRDLIDEIRQISVGVGIKISTDTTLDKCLLDYLTVKEKWIDIKPRIVKINPSFKAKIEHHSKRKEIKTIITNARLGENLNIFQSKKLFQTKFFDFLGNTWHIKHFHLSTTFDNKTGFVKQGNELLFAFIDSKQFIVLGTDTHKKGVFADPKWLEILHDHFPETIEKYKENSWKDVRPIVSPEERQILWSKGYTLLMTKVKDGIIYRNPGIGRMTSGHSNEVSQMCNKILRWIRKIELQLRDAKTELCMFFGKNELELEFVLKIEEKIRLYEKNTNFLLLSFPDILIEKEEIGKQRFGN